MKTLAFKASDQVSVGVELELQIIDPHSFGLADRAKDLIRHICKGPYKKQIKPEITQSMIEVNSTIHHSIASLEEELITIQKFMLNLGSEFNLHLCGGGTHPFQKWSSQHIFPTPRYRQILKKFSYLAQRATVFGQHVHIGCKSPQDALYLTHALTKYVPHLIAITAASPFYQGVDTGFYSSRSNVFSAFPLSGVIPYLTTWQEVSDYYNKMKELGIIKSMKDFYWDIRPKPEFGTVEIRVCDTPLTIHKAMLAAAYVQALSFYLLEEKPIEISPELYYVYNSNRFQASRFGFEGHIIDPDKNENYLIKEDILKTIKKIEWYANQLNSMTYIVQLANEVSNSQNDTVTLRRSLKQHNSYAKVVAEQCKIWSFDNKTN